ncbi:DUF3299 domain-containing protein [Pseudomonas sp. G11-1]|uniref:DUF3299 domain-containing protein n=1 Tax=Halopseudomonas bauzanensis TaxID=653930 RepID=A0A4U0YSG6_9GAMM|nr:DUF3299 domain-containing protein [Halopseudomonas bauzanensis]MCO5786973.1 DUF3299 domain-containing protein [Pseudomonas sp. G11-1]MCO5790199.1 DUF3299 domain-containing protein [Pseudomonas sp. G11-2]TKA92864.1 DUF3299 domain-containing protein [Halopseudomonas bauzanensis]
MRHLLITLALLFPILAMAAPRTVDWLDLLPEEDYQAMLDMPEISHDWGTEAPGDFSNSLRSSDRNLPEVMYSTRVVGEMDGQHIELGGYPVPLETDEQGRYISFFLVPYPGACIHVPPPPPNQIILVEYPSGLAIRDIYQPLLLTGTLRVAQTSNELADASYRMRADKVVSYPGG